MKKVSVGEVRDVGVNPKRGKKKGFMILIIVAVILIALFLIGNTGCSNKKSSTTTPTATVLPIPDRVSGLESRVTYIENHPNTFDATALWSTVNALHNYDDTSVLARLVALEGLNMSTFTGDLAFVNVRLATYDGYNISARLAALEARPIYAPTPTPNASVTPTPTPVPSTNHAPTILSMSSSSMGTNQSWMIGCTANDSDSDVLHFNWAVTNGNVYPLSSGDAVIWQLTVNGTQSIVCQVNDGKDGYDIEIRTVVW